MKVTDFVETARQAEEAETRRQDNRRKSAIEEHCRVFPDLLTKEAYRALGLDLSEIVETEGTTEIYVRGEFEVEGETPWIQVNVSEMGVAEVTLPHHTNDVLYRDDFDNNVKKIGTLIREYLRKVKSARHNAQIREVSVLRSRIQNTTIDNKDEGLEQLSAIKEQVVSEESPLTAEAKQTLLNHIGSRATEIHQMYNKRKVVAKQIHNSADEYSILYSGYMTALESYAQAETDRLWSPWEARRITYPLVEGTLHIHLGDEEESFYREGVTLNERLTNTIVVDKQVDKDGWLIEYRPNGSIQRVQVKTIMETRPVEFNDKTIDRPLDYHLSFPVGEGIFINVPPWIDDDFDMADPPDPPEQRWGERLDAIPHITDVFPHDMVDRLYVDQGEEQHEYVFKLLRDYL